MADERGKEPEEKERAAAPVAGPLGLYTNIARVSHTIDEFTFEFGVRLGGKVAGLHTKVVSSPTHAKRFLRALKQNLDRYEKQFGPIREEPVTQKERADARQ